jgi:hypothetical protein
MKQIVKLTVLAGIFVCSSWISPGTVAPAQAATCPGGYGDCRILAGKSCTSSKPCCDGADEGFCTCSGGRYFCAI